MPCQSVPPFTRACADSQVLAMAEAVPGPAPQGEQLQALLDAPAHCLARLARDLFATPSSCAATLEVCGSIIASHCCVCQSYCIAATYVCTWRRVRLTI